VDWWPQPGCPPSRPGCGWTSQRFRRSPHLLSESTLCRFAQAFIPRDPNTRLKAARTKRLRRALLVQPGVSEAGVDEIRHGVACLGRST
jgi:hypothetical protein